MYWATKFTQYNQQSLPDYHVKYIVKSMLNLSYTYEDLM